jgi:hypothetical protein
MNLPNHRLANPEPIGRNGGEQPMGTREPLVTPVTLSLPSHTTIEIPIQQHETEDHQQPIQEIETPGVTQARRESDKRQCYEEETRSQSQDTDYGTPRTVSDTLLNPSQQFQNATQETDTMDELQIIHLSLLKPLDHTKQTTDQLKEFLGVNHADMQMIILCLDEFLTEQHILIKKIDDDLQKEFLKGQEDLMIPTKIKEIIINQIIGQMSELDSLICKLLKWNFQVSICNQPITKLLEHQVILMEDPQMTITGMIITLEIGEGEYLLIGNVVVIPEDRVMEEATEEVQEEALVDPVDPVDLVDLEILDTPEISI